MKKVNKLIVFAIGILIGAIACVGFETYKAGTYNASHVQYSNTTSGSSQTTVKGAIDDLYTKAG